MGLLSRNRQAFNRDTQGTDERQYFSAIQYAQYAITLPIVLETARGDVLDVGAGDAPFRAVVEPRVSSYQTADREARIGGVDYICSADAMDPVPSEAFDTVLLIEVLEHLANPEDALAEIFRVLKPGGRLVLSVPHLSRLHEQPHDYYRYTEFGLRHRLEQAGFDVSLIRPRGGLLSFLAHQVSTGVVCSTWHLPVIGSAAFAFNKRFLVRAPLWLDGHLDREGLFPLGYVAVAERPGGARR